MQSHLLSLSPFSNLFPIATLLEKFGDDRGNRLYFLIFRTMFAFLLKKIKINFISLFLSLSLTQSREQKAKWILLAGFRAADWALSPRVQAKAAMVLPAVTIQAQQPSGTNYCIYSKTCKEMYLPISI